MKTLFKYIRYSNIQITLNLNPFVWGFYFEKVKDDPWQPYAVGFHLKVIMFRLSIIIDNGEW